MKIQLYEPILRYEKSQYRLKQLYFLVSRVTAIRY
nr:MAG TPA: hypothetical protein [Caudoviricetes sp.]